MPRPTPPHPNPLVRARNRLSLPPAELAARLAIPLHALINAECGVPHKIPPQYYAVTSVTPDDGHEYQAFRALRRRYYSNQLPAVVLSEGSDFKDFLDSHRMTPLKFSRLFCVPEVETYRAYLGLPFSVTLKEVLSACER